VTAPVPPPADRADPDGPWFDDFEVGQRFEQAPVVTLTSGLAAVHQSIVGDRLRLALDDDLARAVTGRAPIAHPGAVCDLAIGQSTLATRNVRANLFYRGLVFHRLPAIGDSLRTVTEVVGLRRNQSRPGRADTGLVALRVTTRDGADRLVLDFLRCAMIPVARSGDAATVRPADDLDALVPPTAPEPAVSTLGWDLAAFRARTGAGDPAAVGTVWTGGGDVVSSAPELARLTLNVAKVHHDARAGGGQRLVYGGHTIGLAFAQASRALPDLVTVLGWHRCDHVGPVHEGDTLRSRLTLERLEPLASGGSVAHLRSEVTADPAAADPGTADGVAAPRPVLDWQFSVLLP
jgi:acyl dehydratase